MKKYTGILIEGLILIGIVIGVIYLKQPKQKTEPVTMQLGLLPEFTLLTQDSTTFTRSNLNGHITIADFIFTSCSGPCPLMTSRMVELQDTLSGLPSIRFLSISVDPDYDTPSILTEYARTFMAETKRWTFLTGDKHQIYTLARYGFHLTTEEEENAILHSTKFILIDSKGSIRGYYDYDDSTAIPKLLSDAQSLANE